MNQTYSTVVRLSLALLPMPIQPIRGGDPVVIVVVINAVIQMIEAHRVLLGLDRDLDSHRDHRGEGDVEDEDDARERVAVPHRRAASVVEAPGAERPD